MLIKILVNADKWTTFKDFYYNHGHQEVRFTNLVLDPGIKYRFVVKLCAKHICYEPQYSDGVRILANPPTTGNIVVQHVNTSGGQEQVNHYNPLIPHFSCLFFNYYLSQILA